MDEIDRGIALQQVPPRPLALVGLARDQQHAQPIAHAVDGEQGAVVVERELVGAGRHFQLDHVGAGIAHRDGELDRLADRHVEPAHHVAAHRQGHRRGAARRILDPELGRDLAADHAEARRLLQHDQPVALTLLAGDQSVQRRGAQLGRQVGRHVVHLAVGQQDHAGQAFRRHFDQRRAHGLDQARAARPFAAELDVRRRKHRLAHFEPFLLAELALQRFARRLDLLAALADRHRIGIVNHHQRHVGDRLPLFLDQRRIAERGQHDRQRAEPPDRAARTGAQAQKHQHQADAAQHGQDGPAEQRIEGDGNGGAGVHRRSLCMMSGM